MNHRIEEIILGISTGVLIGLFGCPVQAADPNSNAHVISPPAVVTGPPTMLFLIDPGVYAAVGSPYDMYYITGVYFYYYSNHWYRGPGYKGPWTHVEPHSLPPGLRDYKIQELHRYRESEFKAYEAQGLKYQGRKFIGSVGPVAPGRGPTVDPRMNGGMDRGRGPRR
ncbi:MAG TPA: hypothetical protein VFH55_12495 [Nitrospiria bacterium]|nr:hypothetical protein [Nitrospiria bacterium]